MDERRTYSYEHAMPTDSPRPYIFIYRAKTNQVGGLKSRKMRIAIQIDLMKPDLDSDTARTASRMLAKSGRYLHLAAAVRRAIVSADVPESYMRVPADSRYRQTMLQPPCFDGSTRKPDKICVLRRSMLGAPGPIFS
jgi:hypothetical protein